MITKRIIACLDVHGGRVVKGVQFVDLVDAGDPATQAARQDPMLIDAIGPSFGAQAVVVAIDARRDPAAADPVRDAQVFVQGGRKPTGRRVVEWAREAEARGAGEILLTSMDCDGMRNGFDCELTAAVSESVGIP